MGDSGMITPKWDICYHNPSCPGPEVIVEDGGVRV